MFLHNSHTMKNMLRTMWRAVLAASLLYPTGHLPAYAGNTNLPDLGDESIAVISPAQERKLGEDLMRRSRRTLAFMNDPEINEYIQSLGQRLASRSDEHTSELQSQFHLVCRLLLEKNNKKFNKLANIDDLHCITIISNNQPTY